MHGKVGVDSRQSSPGFDSEQQNNMLCPEIRYSTPNFTIDVPALPLLPLAEASISHTIIFRGSQCQSERVCRGP